MLVLWLFAMSGHLMLLLYCVFAKFRTMYANVLKMHMWIPHENIGDLYFFLIRIIAHFPYFPFNKITLKSRIFVLLLRSWASSVGVKHCYYGHGQAVLESSTVITVMGKQCWSQALLLPSWASSVGSQAVLESSSVSHAVRGMFYKHLI